MNGKLLIRAAFIVWVATITVLAVIPHSSNGIMVSSNVTRSGMEKHIVGYFVATLLCYFAYKREGALFLLMTGFLIFCYSVVLETIQFILPYRTFNMYDIIANATGIFFTVLICWIGSSHFLIKRQHL